VCARCHLAASVARRSARIPTEFVHFSIGCELSAEARTSLPTVGNIIEGEKSDKCFEGCSNWLLLRFRVEVDLFGWRLGDERNVVGT
jgi:hypothetical protein